MIAVFLQFPKTGEVMTRLALEVGRQAANKVHKLCVEATLEACRELDTELHYDPATAFSRYQKWLGRGYFWRPQRGANQVRRIENALAALVQRHHKVLWISTECPQLSRADLLEAYARLDECEAVLGPATSGGCYLVGVRDRLPDLFNGVAWSSSLALEQMLSRLEGRKVSLLRVLTDIDTKANLENVARQMAPPWGERFLEAIPQYPETQAI